MIVTGGDIDNCDVCETPDVIFCFFIFYIYLINVEILIIVIQNQDKSDFE
jgi:hypothetical protein